MQQKRDKFFSRLKKEGGLKKTQSSHISCKHLRSEASEKKWIVNTGGARLRRALSPLYNARDDTSRTVYMAISESGSAIFNFLYLRTNSRKMSTAIISIFLSNRLLYVAFGSRGSLEVLQGGNLDVRLLGIISHKAAGASNASHCRLSRRINLNSWSEISLTRENKNNTFHFLRSTAVTSCFPLH